MPAVTLKIAKIPLTIACERESPILWLTTTYTSFVTSSKSALHVFLELDSRWKSNGRSLFSPPLEWQSNNYYITTSIFEARFDFARKKVTIKGKPDVGLVDVIRFLCSMMIMRKGGFLLHASSVLDRDGSYVFFGPSESGKTTIARLAPDTTVLTDETTAIIRRNGLYQAYATPFWGDYGPTNNTTGGPIKAAFLIKKNSDFMIRKLETGETVRELFSNVIIPIPDRNVSDKLFTTFKNFAAHVPCYELSFKPEPTLWRYLHECLDNESEKK